MMEDFYELIDKMIGMSSKIQNALIKYKDTMRTSTQRIDTHLKENLKMLSMEMSEDGKFSIGNEKEELKEMISDIKEMKKSLDEIATKDRWIKWIVGALTSLVLLLGIISTYMNKLSINQITKEIKQEIKK